MKERIDAFEEYVSNAKECLNLTSPQLDELSDGEEYRLYLQESFRRIGELGEASNIILEKNLFPILAADYMLTEEDVDDLKQFSTLLADMIIMENTDPILIYLQAEKILERARRVGDVHALIVALDNMIISTYMMVNITIRLYPDKDICFKYRDRGLAAGYEMLEYLLTIDSDNITEEESESLVAIYEKLVEYAFRMPKTGVLSFMLTFIHNIFREYILVPGGLSLKDMCLRIMAAMHPTTYVHTLNVAAITEYLALKLIDRNPELLIGVCNTKNAEEVVQRKNEIAEFAHDGALLHDIGKIFIVETIITYWRRLLESEWELIKTHPVVGASLLRRFPNTAEFAELAMGHHKWYDDSKGYPEDFRLADAKYPAFVSLLSVADCLDAATDSIGRTYKKGKSLNVVIEELEADSGTRYAPYAVELLRDPDVKKELNRMLTEGRDDNYRNTYTLLKSLSL